MDGKTQQKWQLCGKLSGIVKEDRRRDRGQQPAPQVLPEAWVARAQGHAAPGRADGRGRDGRGPQLSKCVNKTVMERFRLEALALRLEEECAELDADLAAAHSRGVPQAVAVNKICSRAVNRLRSRQLLQLCIADAGAGGADLLHPVQLALSQARLHFDTKPASSAAARLRASIRADATDRRLPSGAERAIHQAALAAQALRAHAAQVLVGAEDDVNTAAAAAAAASTAAPDGAKDAAAADTSGLQPLAQLVVPGGSGQAPHSMAATAFALRSFGSGGSSADTEADRDASESPGPPDVSRSDQHDDDAATARYRAVVQGSRELALQARKALSPSAAAAAAAPEARGSEDAGDRGKDDDAKSIGPESAGTADSTTASDRDSDGGSETGGLSSGRLPLRLWQPGGSPRQVLAELLRASGQLQRRAELLLMAGGAPLSGEPATLT